MYIFLFIFIFLIVILVLGLSIVGAILRAVFGIGKRSSYQPKQKRSDYNQGTNTTSDNKEDTFVEGGPKNKHKKIFTEDEGEYVDFEEIK